MENKIIDPLVIQGSDHPMPLQASVSVPAVINLDGVESGYGAFLRNRWWQIALLVIVCVATTALLTKYQGNPFDFMFGIIIFIFGMGYFKQTYEHNLFKAFATTNHFEYQEYGKPGCSTAGLVFAVGHNKDYAYVVSGVYQTWPFTLCMYKYDTGQGRNTTGHDRTIMTVNFGVSLPMFVLRRPKLFQMLAEDSSAIKNADYTNARRYGNADRSG